MSTLGLSDDVAIAALVIALVSFVNAVGQLLQQYFATADGYRRCQPSVMGLWSKRARLRFRWRQFRFETQFEIPIVTIGGYPSNLGKFDRRIPITGFEKSRNDTLLPEGYKDKHFTPETVSWLYLLEELHCLGHVYPNKKVVSEGRSQSSGDLEANHLKQESGLSLSLKDFPTIQFWERSWDAIPPDIVKPLAITNLSSIAIIARRLGMLWKTFDIHQSIFHAEGNGMVMTTAVARSSVTVIQFDSGGRKTASFPLDQIYIPSEDADRLGFGIITTWYKDPMTKEPDRFVMRPEDETSDLKMLVEGKFPDIVPFASRMLHEKGSLVIRIPKPHGLISIEIGMRYFWRLQRLRDVHPELSQLQWLYETCEHLNISSPGGWTKAKSGKGFLDDIHDHYDKTTSYFDNLEKLHNLRYKNLMIYHLEHEEIMWNNILSPDNLDKDRTPKSPRDWTRGPVPLHEDEDRFRDVLDDFYEAMAGTGYSGTVSQVVEAWATMIFRGICWNFCHSMVEGERVPSRIWGSRLPVYIG